ncbi:MAG: response regulator [Bacteroidota bacterium]
MKNILLVEDYKLVIKVIKHLVKQDKLALKIDVAYNGKIAVDKVSEDLDKYDAVIMNGIMPIMDGVEATKILRDMGFSAPIIGFSALNTPEYISSCLAAGMNRFVGVGKLSSIDELIATLKNMGLC